MRNKKKTSENVTAFSEATSNFNSNPNNIIHQNSGLGKVKEVLKKITTWCNMRINDDDNKDIFKFLQEKWGFSKEFINKYKIGFFPVTSNSDIKKWAREREFKFSWLKKAGLVNDGGFSHFQGRIIFPYLKDGQVVYLIGRKTDKNPDSKYEHAKYKKLLTKSEKYPDVVTENKYFAGEDSIKEGSDYLLITEGITDCLRAIEEGFNCVSPVTTTFRKDDFSKIFELSKQVKTVYIANDSEENGRGLKGAKKTAKYLAKRAIDVRIVKLPRDEGVEKIDLADYLTANSADNLWALMRQAKPFKVKPETTPKVEYDEDNTVFKKIKEEVNILEVWNRFGDGQEAKDVNIKCPFHDDNTPSMRINYQKDYFNCFACEAAGDSIKLLELLENIEPIEAAKLINKEFSLNLDLDNYSNVKKEVLETIVERGIKFLDENHKENLKNKYGLSEERIETAKVGYLPEKSYTDLNFKKLKKLKLAVKTDKGITQTLRDCFIVPNLDAKGKVEDINGVIGKTPFANFTEANTIIVAESSLECLALKEAGYDTVLGKTLIAKRLDKYEEVILISQDDLVISSLLKENIFPKILAIPDEKTIGEYLAFKDHIDDIIKESKGFLKSKYEEIKNSKNGREAVKKVDELCPFLARLDSSYQSSEIEEIRVALKEVTGSKNTLTKSEVKKKIKDAAKEIDIDFKPWFSEKGFKVSPLAEELQQRYHILTLGSSSGTPDKGTLYCYEDGVFKNNGEAKLQKILQAEAYLGEGWKKRRADDTISYLKRSSYTSHKEVIEKNIKKYPKLINVKNGMLNLEGYSLSKHDPSFKSLNQLNCEYNPQARCKRLEEFIEEVLIDPKEPDHSKIDLFWEFVGWTIYNGGINMKKMLFLVGEGNNGKSLLLSVITALLGSDNYSSLKLKAITENDYAAGDLFGKRANINGDLDSNDIQDTSLIKQLTGGDVVSVDQKYKDRLSFKNRATLIFALNDLPKVRDYSEAYFNRLVILNMPNTFTDNSEPNLLKKITTEEAKSYALNQALKGIKRLKDNDWAFTSCESSKKAVNEYIAMANSVVAFLKERCEADTDNYVTKANLYREFKYWAEDNGYRQMTKNNFGRRIKKNPIINIKSAKKSIAGKERRIWEGINLKFSSS